MVGRRLGVKGKNYKIDFLRNALLGKLVSRLFVEFFLPLSPFYPHCHFTLIVIYPHCLRGAHLPISLIVKPGFTPSRYGSGFFSRLFVKFAQPSLLLRACGAILKMYT